MEESRVTLAEGQARAFFTDVLSVATCLDRSTWLFGDDAGPTVLDAHCVPFIARLLDSKESDLVPDELQAYAAKIMALPEWNDVTRGRPTHWNIKLGHVRTYGENF